MSISSQQSFVPPSSSSPSSSCTSISPASPAAPPCSSPSSLSNTSNSLNTRHDRDDASSSSTDLPFLPPPSDGCDDSRPALNPLAKEFIPIHISHASSSQGFTAGGEATERTGSISALNNSSPTEEVIEDLLNDKRQRIKPRKDDAFQRSGGLSAALKQGNGKVSAVSRSSDGIPDGSSHQTISGAAGVGKRAQFTNANYLLNFQYDPIVRPPSMPRIPYNRKVQKIQPFNKELFLQANFRFLVSDYGDYLLNSSDPDKMLPWEDIAAVNVSAPIAIQCPICLESPPLCPQITSCGHIFCFPCILRYLALGENQQRSDYHKKCPLCFAMISSKALRTVLADNVHNYQVGDNLELTLLNRAKGSMIPFEKSHPVVGALPFNKDGQCHSFSKFTLTSDADHITNKAITELSSWAEKAQNEGGEDIDLLPYIFLAIEQLQERKSAWDEHRVSEFISSSPPVRHRIIAQSGQGFKLSHTDSRIVEEAQSVYQGKQEDVTVDVEAAMADLKDIGGWTYENAFSDDDDDGVKSKLMRAKTSGKDTSGIITSPDIPSSWEENLDERLEKVKLSSTVDKDLQEGSRIDGEEGECYTFYQCADGQPLILHPLNMKCMLQHYGSHENFPPRLRAKIVEMEGQIQTESTRKRYRYLSHLPLTTNFWFCELDLRGVLPSSAFSLYIDEIRSREIRRRRRRKQEQDERARNERMSASQNRVFPPVEVMSSIENHLEVEERTSAYEDAPATSPAIAESPMEERKLFSQVTRLGFASAHDAPDLTPKIPHDTPLSNQRASTSAGASAASKVASMSFADAIQSQSLKSTPKSLNGTSPSNTKKSKKATKIILSTAGGRRY